MQKQKFRLFSWLFISLGLLALSLWCQSQWPGNVLTVTVYKAHLMALGGYGGYWLDRALFPYSRPHEHLYHQTWHSSRGGSVDQAHADDGFAPSTLRRAIIVAACLICVGLGA